MQRHVVQIPRKPLWGTRGVQRRCQCLALLIGAPARFVWITGRQRSQTHRELLQGFPRAVGLQELQAFTYQLRPQVLIQDLLA